MEGRTAQRRMPPCTRWSISVRGFSLFLAVLMLLSLFPASAFAFEEMDAPEYDLVESEPGEEFETELPADPAVEDLPEPTPEPGPLPETTPEPDFPADAEPAEPDPVVNAGEGNNSDLPGSGESEDDEDEDPDEEDLDEDEENWDENEEYPDDELIEEDHLYERYGISRRKPGASGPLNMVDGTFFTDFAGIAKAEACESGDYLRSHLGIPEDGEIPDIAYRVAPFNEKYPTWYFDRIYPEDFRAADAAGSLPVADLDCCFILWCADRMGYVSHGFFPETDSLPELLTALESHGNIIFDRNDRFFSPEANDLMFVAEKDGIGFDRAGVVIRADEDELTYVFCNRFGYPEERTVPVQEFPAGTAFVRITDIQNAQLVQAADYLERKLDVPPAVAAGILANIGYESDYYPRALGDDDTSYGLCQWHKDRWDDLIVFCEARGLNFRTTLGQFRFLVYELMHTKKQMPTLDLLRSFDDTAEGAYLSAYYFCTEFEQPEDAAIKGEIRGRYAFQTVFPALFSEAKLAEIMRDVEALTAVFAAQESDDDRLIDEQDDDIELAEDIPPMSSDSEVQEEDVLDSEAVLQETAADSEQGKNDNLLPEPEPEESFAEIAEP